VRESAGDADEHRTGAQHADDDDRDRGGSTPWHEPRIA
jgi:hypothetical protein